MEDAAVMPHATITRNKGMKRVITTIGAALLTAVLMLGSIPAYAATGTLTIKPMYGSSGIENYTGTFDVYKVADFDAVKVTVTPVSPFDGYTGSPRIQDAAGMNDTQFKNLVNAVRDYYNSSLKDSGRLGSPKASNIGANGTCQLDHGLYLVVQHTSDSTYNDVDPFLVFLPDVTGISDGGSATAYPKLSKPSTPPDDDNPPGDDNPPKDTPPEKEQPQEESGEVTPEQPETPGEEIGGMDESGIIEEHGATGDNSQIVTYGVVTGVAAVALIGWAVWKRKSNKQQ